MTGKPSLAARVEDLVTRELTRIKDPERRLLAAHELAEALPALGGTVRALRADAIRTYRRTDDRRTWASIGDLLGVSHQRAEQMSRTTIEDAIR